MTLKSVPLGSAWPLREADQAQYLLEARDAIVRGGAEELRLRLPLRGGIRGAALESWTLLAALAAQTSRLRLGVMVTSNRLRSATLLAKMAATVDVVAAGRLDFGIGVGGSRVALEKSGDPRVRGLRRPAQSSTTPRMGPSMPRTPQVLGGSMCVSSTVTGRLA